MSNPNKQPQTPNHRSSKKPGARTLLAVGLSALAGAVAPGVASAVDGLPEGRIQPITIEAGKGKLTAPQRAEIRAMNGIKRPTFGGPNGIYTVLRLGEGSKIQTAPHARAAASTVGKGQVVEIINPLAYTDPKTGNTWYAAVGSNKGNHSNRTFTRPNTVWVSDANFVSNIDTVAPPATFFDHPDTASRLDRGETYGIFVSIGAAGRMRTAGKDGGMPIATLSVMPAEQFDISAARRGLISVNK